MRLDGRIPLAAGTPLLVVAWLIAAAPAAAVNYALDFQQLNDPYVKDHLRLVAHPAISGELTVEFWMRADDSIPFCPTENDPQGCWSTGNTWYYGNFIFDGHQNFEQNPGRDSFDVVVANSGRLKVVLGPGDEETDGTTDVVSGGLWHHVAVVREWTGAADHRVRLFVDGQLDGEQQLPGRDPLLLIFPYWGTERADWAGAGPADFPDYFGLVDEIRYWSVARSQAEIQATMGSELAGDEPGLVHYLRLNEGQGRLAHDMRSDNDGIFFELQPDSWVLSDAPLTQQPGPDCGDGLQNQGELGVDCGGPCFPCPPLVEVDCTDGVDEDLDGPLDCADPDCVDDAACVAPPGSFAIAADDRDADYNPVEGVMLGNVFDRGQVCCGRDGARWWQLGLQFAVDLPVPVTITEARLVLTSSGDNSGSFTTRIRAVDQDDVAAFVPGASTAFSEAYALTPEFVDWVPPAAAAGEAVESPDVRALVQRVVDRGGWQSGSHIGFVLGEAPGDGEWRCYRDWFAGPATAARLELGFYAAGAPVCLDARAGGSALNVLREPAGGCPQAPGGPPRDFVFGSVAELSAQPGSVDLGNVRCAAPPATTEEVVPSADPDLPWPGVRFYLWRPAGAADFGAAELPDGSAPPRQVSGAIPCP